MDQLKRRLSFRKKKDRVPECSKPHQWQEDEKKVRDATCSFQVRYMGCLEVFESRGMQVCEDAVKALRAQCKGKYQRAILYVSGDALRVVDEISKSMVVDQTIEKVSFCAPDRNHEKGFAYICRDGTTRRWMCHSFLAVKESTPAKTRSPSEHLYQGERLSHAVGCAFAICLEKKQRREKDSANSVQVSYNPNQTSFTRTGSFRQTSLTERISDPQMALVAEPVPVAKIDMPFAVQRPHATSNLLEKQGSFRGFNKLHESSSPFKRTLSLRLSELPSTLKRQNAILESPNERISESSPIHEASLSQEQSPDTIGDVCQQVTKGLGALSDDPFSNAPSARRQAHLSRSVSASTPRGHDAAPHTRHFESYSPQATLSTIETHQEYTMPPVLQPQPAIQPIKQTNPWSVDMVTPKSPTADDWLRSSAITSPTSPGNPFSPHSLSGGGGTTRSNGHDAPAPPDKSSLAIFGPMSQTTRVIHRPHLPQFPPQQQRSQSFEASRASVETSKRPTLAEIASQQHSFQQNGNVGGQWPPEHAASPVRGALSGSSSVTAPDPFDVQWAAKATTGVNSNPFKSKNEFQVQI